MSDGVTFHIGVWYSGTPEQFLLHFKQAMHSVQWARLVGEYYSAREKCIAAQKNWEKVLTSIVKYEKDNAKKGPFRDFEAVLKVLKKEQDSFLKAQTRPKPSVLYWQMASSPKRQPAFCCTARSLGEDRQTKSQRQ